MSPYLERERERVVTEVGEKSLTKQSEADACDINAIMRRYQSTGVLDHQAGQAARYGDFSNVEDYLASLNKVREAQQRFDDLPSKIRDHVENEPGKFLELVFDPERKEEMVQLGLLPEPEKETKVDLEAEELKLWREQKKAQAEKEASQAPGGEGAEAPKTVDT